MAYPPGLRTDLAIHRLQGARIEEHDDHLIVRTPHNPTYHWGNCLWVTDPDAVGTPARWAAEFERTFPAATWRAIGLVRPPAAAVWRAAGYAVEVSESLVAHAAPEVRELPAGYRARALAGPADWAATAAFRLAEHATSGRDRTPRDDDFIRAEAASRRRLVEGGSAAWFAAYDPSGAHVAELGVVDCAGEARFQSIMTDAAHRGRGLAGHLIGRAADWAARRGCTSWVIVVHAGNPARRLYRSLGFEPAAETGEAYRAG